MNENEALRHFDVKQRPPEVRALASRAQFWMSAAIGLSWGMALMEFMVRVLPLLPATLIGIGVGAAVLLAFMALRAPQSWFQLPHPGRSARRYRALGMARFRRLMVDGDLLNAEARRLLPGYRLVQASAADLQAYALRTRKIERDHLAWLAASLPFIVLALLAGRWTWALGMLVLTVLTNVLPIGLQRFNRARCLVLLDKMRARIGLAMAGSS